MTTGNPDYFAGFAVPIQRFVPFTGVNYTLGHQTSRSVSLTSVASTTVFDISGIGRLLALTGVVFSAPGGAGRSQLELTIDGTTYTQTLYSAVTNWSSIFLDYVTHRGSNSYLVGAAGGDAFHLPMSWDFLTQCKLVLNVTQADGSGSFVIGGYAVQALNA
jgi:hypothetical protein